MSESASLATELARMKADSAERSPARAQVVERALAELEAAGTRQRALHAGDPAPDRVLPDALGRPVQLSSLWSRGPLVLLFYRGGWCPYCNLQLRAWEQRRLLVTALDASIAAVSPQQPDDSLSTAEKNELAFPVLSDPDLRLAEAFGVAFEMPPELVEMYREIGKDLPAINGNGRWALPVPATYVIGGDGRIAFAHVEVDYRERAEPDAVLELLRKLRQ